MPKQTYSAFQIALIFAASTFCFALMTAFAKHLSEYSTTQIVFFRNFVAFIFVFAVIILRGRVQLLRTTRIKDHLWRGIFGISSMFCFFASYKFLPLAEASAIGHAQPIFLAILSVVFLGERPKPRRWLAILSGLTGVLIMLNPQGLSSYVGLFFALAYSFLGACAMIMVHRLGKTEASDTVVFYFMLWGSIISFVFLPFAWKDLCFNDFLFMLGTGVFGALGQLLMVYGYRRAEASLIAALNYMQIVWSALIGYYIWSEIPRISVIFGALVVLLSQVLLIGLEGRRNRNLAA